ncbi:MAG: hypothetical protein WC261_12530, partial [Synergistaceae bacterium]
MTPEEQRARSRAYYQEHREEILAKKRVYDMANREKRAAYQKEYRKTRGICRVLKEHKEALADDPERLSTDFILRLVQGENGKTGLLQKLPG